MEIGPRTLPICSDAGSDANVRNNASETMRCLPVRNTMKQPSTPISISPSVVSRTAKTPTVKQPSTRAAAAASVAGLLRNEAMDISGGDRGIVGQSCLPERFAIGRHGRLGLPRHRYTGEHRADDVPASRAQL